MNSIVKNKIRFQPYEKNLSNIDVKIHVNDNLD